MTDSDKTSDSTGFFSTIAASECRELLSGGTIGRIAFNSDVGIQLLPLNDLYLDGSIYCRVDAGSVLGELAGGSDDVAFGVDYVEELFKEAWSVLVTGTIGAVTEAAEMAKLRGQRKLEPWAIGDRQLYLRLEPVTITGRRVKRNAR